MSYANNSFGSLSGRRSVKSLCLKMSEVTRVERYLNDPYIFKHTTNRVINLARFFNLELIHNYIMTCLILLGLTALTVVELFLLLIVASILKVLFNEVDSWSSIFNLNILLGSFIFGIISIYFYLMHPLYIMLFTA